MNSQFLIWLGDIEYKHYKYTLVFGRSFFPTNCPCDKVYLPRVVEGLSKLQEVSRVRSMQVFFLNEKLN